MPEVRAVSAAQRNLEGGAAACDDFCLKHVCTEESSALVFLKILNRNWMAPIWLFLMPDRGVPCCKGVPLRTILILNNPGEWKRYQFVFMIALA